MLFAICTTIATCGISTSHNNEVLEHYFQHLESGDTQHLLFDYFLNIVKNHTNEVCRNFASLIVQCMQNRFKDDIVLF